MTRKPFGFSGIEQVPMKAITVAPGRANSVHLAERARPSVSDLPNGRGVPAKVPRVGREIFDRLQNQNGAIKIFGEVAAS